MNIFTLAVLSIELKGFQYVKLQFTLSLKPSVLLHNKFLKFLKFLPSLYLCRFQRLLKVLWDGWHPKVFVVVTYLSRFWLFTYLFGGLWLLLIKFWRPYEFLIPGNIPLIGKPNVTFLFTLSFLFISDLFGQLPNMVWVYYVTPLIILILIFFYCVLFSSHLFKNILNFLLCCQSQLF